MKHLRVAYETVTRGDLAEEDGVEGKDKSFYCLSLWNGVVALATFTLIMGLAALWRCFSGIGTDTFYCIILLGMIIPNLTGDVYIAMWLVKDNNYNRDKLVNGAALNLMGILAQTIWEILDHHSFKHWWDDRHELVEILLRGGGLCVLCFYFYKLS